MWKYSIDLLWLIVLKEFLGATPEAVRFLQSKDIKIPKIDAKNTNANLYHISPLDYCNFQQGTMAHPGPH